VSAVVPINQVLYDVDADVPQHIWFAAARLVDVDIYPHIIAVIAYPYLLSGIKL